MEYHDYDCEMLRLYFDENHFPEWKRKKLLESNPFDKNYIIWEKQTKNNNKTFAIILKKMNIVNENIPIQEITVHKDNSVGMFLNNEIVYIPCSITSDINKIKLQNKLVIMKGFYHNENIFLKKLQHKSIPFITGICSKQHGYYLHVLNEYKKMLKDLKNCELITEQNNDQYISIIKTK